jgi:hypothetical protein
LWDWELNGAPGEIRTPGLLIRSRNKAIFQTVADQQGSTAFNPKHLHAGISSAVIFVDLWCNRSDKNDYSKRKK